MGTTGLGEPRLVAAALAVGATVALRDVAGAGVPDALLLGEVCALLLAVRRESVAPLLFFLFPLTCGIPGYVTLGGYAVLLSRCGRPSVAQLWPAAAVALLEVMTEGWPPDADTYMGAASFLSFCGLFFYLLNDRRRAEYDLPRCVLYFALGTALTMVVILHNMLAQYDLDYILSGLARSGALGAEDNDQLSMRGHLAMNANTMAYYALCTVSCLALLLPRYKRRALPLVLLVAVGGMGFLSVSRTYVMCLALFTLLYVAASGGRAVMKSLALLGAVALGVAVFAENYFDVLFGSFVGRAEGDNVETAGGRTLIFALYNAAWLERPLCVLLGSGVVNYMDTMGISAAMHSGLQQIWVCLGVSGLALYAAQVGGFLRRHLDRRHLRLALPFLVTLLFDQSIQFLNPYPLMLPLCVALLVCKAGRESGGTQ